MSFLDKIFHRKEEVSEENNQKYDFGEGQEDESPDFNLNSDMLDRPAEEPLQQPKGNEDLVISRLETINAKLDNIMNRLEKLEKIAERESGSEDW